MTCLSRNKDDRVGDSKIIIGETGRVVVPGDADALAGAWGELLALRPEDRQRLGWLARERIRMVHDNKNTISTAKCVRVIFAFEGTS